LNLYRSAFEIEIAGIFKSAFPTSKCAAKALLPYDCIFAMNLDLPKLLKQDAIVESLLEFQFEHDQVGEVILGRLAAADGWRDYQSSRLPLADLPQSIRDSDPNLRFQPILQLQNANGTEVVKVGPKVVSLHRLGGYPGWSKFRERAEFLIDALLQAVPDIQIARIGLRYVNSLLPSHGFNSFWDMNIDVKVAGEQPAETVATNYRYSAGDNCGVQVAIAHPVYVNGPVVPGSVALVDVDVFTQNAVGSSTREELLQWLDQAHNIEKQAFFKLWPSDKLAAQRID
jgi:uncharacterized protein (TIGR04255 family)